MNQRVRNCTTRNVCILMLISTTVGSSFFSCRKTDDSPPVITLTVPANGAVFGIGEEIVADAVVTDNVGVQWIQCVVSDGQSLPVLTQVLQEPGGEGQVNFHAVIPFTDVHLETGNYSLRVTASDGENEHTVYRDIHLNGAPTVLQGVFLIRSAGIGTTEVDTLAQDNTWSQAFSRDMDYDLGGINSYYDDLLLAGRSYEGIYSVEALSGVDNGHIDTPSAFGDDHFESIVYDRDRHSFYIGTRDGIIREVRNDGQVVSVLTLTDGLKAVQLLPVGDLLIAAAENDGGTIFRIEVFHALTLQWLGSLNTTEHCVALLPSENGMLVRVISNVGLQPMVRLFDPADMMIWDDVVSWHSSPVLLAITGENGMDYVVHDDGLRVYQGSDPASGELPGLVPSVIRHDPVGGVLYALDQDVLYRINDQLTGIPEAIPLPSEARDVLLWYNK